MQKTTVSRWGNKPLPDPTLNPMYQQNQDQTQYTNQNQTQNKCITETKAKLDIPTKAKPKLDAPTKNQTQN